MSTRTVSAAYPCECGQPVVGVRVMDAAREHVTFYTETPDGDWHGCPVARRVERWLMVRWMIDDEQGKPKPAAALPPAPQPPPTPPAPPRPVTWSTRPATAPPRPSERVSPRPRKSIDDLLVEVL